MLAAYAVVLVCAGAISHRLLWGAMVALVGVFALAPPLLSLDVFSYVSYARLEAVHGLNPYEYPPAAVPSDPAVPFVADFRGQVSVYGPLFTLATLPLGLVGVAGAVWSLKAIAAVSVLATALIASRVAASRGSDPAAAAALVALNPLVLVHVVGGAHNDALLALAMTAGVALVLAGREASGGAGLLAAAAVKAAALVVAPFALLGSERRGPLVVGFAAAGVAVVALGLVFFGSAIDEALRVVGDNQENPSYASVPATLSRELGADIDTMRGALPRGLRPLGGAAAALVRAGRGLGPRRGLGGPGAAAREQLPHALVRDLAAAAGGRCPRPRPGRGIGGRHRVPVAPPGPRARWLSPSRRAER